MVKKKEISSIKVDKPKQILLCNTNREYKYYTKGIKYRLNGKYQRIPNFVVKKDGKTEFLNKEDVTSFFLEGYHKKDSIIVIALENRGWLRRRSTDGKYVDWLGDIYNNKAHEKKWRGELFWDGYTTEQMKEVAKLIDLICEVKKTEKNFIGHNVLVDGVQDFKGVVSRSNYNEYWTDLGPSFNFEIL
tara:strand:+ start:143 stop:706 length:564 start_codon:yes stop_codon:yes gene_type:complete